MELTIDPTTRVLRAFVDEVVLMPTAVAAGSRMEVWPGIHCENASTNGRGAHLDDIVVTR